MRRSKLQLSVPIAPGCSVQPEMLQEGKGGVRGIDSNILGMSLNSTIRSKSNIIGFRASYHFLHLTYHEYFRAVPPGPGGAAGERGRSHPTGSPILYPATRIPHPSSRIPPCTRQCRSASRAKCCNWILITQLSERLFLFLCLLMQLFSCPILALTLQEEGIFQSA